MKNLVFQTKMSEKSARVVYYNIAANFLGKAKAKNYPTLISALRRLSETVAAIWV